MNKQILIPSALLLAAGCSTTEGFSSDALMGDAPSAKSIEEELPFADEALIQGLVDAVVNLTAADKSNAVLAMRSYALPLGPESVPEVLPGQCGEAPELSSLKVLESDCAGMNLRWGWEIDVTDCEVDGETFAGTMQITYNELRDVPAFMPQDFVMEDAQQAITNNAEGLASLRYSLNVSSPLSVVDSCGEEFGPAGFRVTDRDTHRFSTTDQTLERLAVQGMQHEMDSNSAAAGRILSNRDGMMEIVTENADPVMVTFLSAGVASEQGDLWPSEGVIEAHVEKQGIVRLRFSPQTAVDGTVEVDTPLGIVIANLPMD